MSLTSSSDVYVPELVHVPDLVLPYQAEVAGYQVEAAGKGWVWAVDKCLSSELNLDAVDDVSICLKSLLVR